MDDDKYKFLQAQARKTGKLPKTLQDEPQLDPGYGSYLDAFYALSRSRDFNGNIALPAIESWLNIAGVADADERLSFARIMMAVDAAFLKDREGKPDG